MRRTFGPAWEILRSREKFLAQNRWAHSTSKAEHEANLILCLYVACEVRHVAFIKTTKTTPFGSRRPRMGQGIVKMTQRCYAEFVGTRRFQYMESQTSASKFPKPRRAIASLGLTVGIDRGGIYDGLRPISCPDSF
jgi:hypothetical protein